MRAIWILFLLFAYFQPLSSQDFAYQSWKSIPNLPAKDICNPLSVDVNNDQIMDLAFSSTDFSNSVLKILSHDGNVFNEFYSSNIINTRIIQMESIDVGTSRLIYLLDNHNTLLKFDLDGLSFTDTITFQKNDGMPLGIKQFQLLGSNGEIEFLGIDDNNLFQFDQFGQEIRRIDSLYVNEFKVGNVDDDPDLEIITTSLSSGLIVDINTFEIDWSYEGGFGNEISLVSENNSDKHLIYGMYSDLDLLCFDASLQEKLWEFRIVERFDHFDISDYDNNGTYELTVNVREIFTVYDLETKSELRSFTSEKWNVDQLLSGDFDNNGQEELFYVSSRNLRDRSNVQLVNPDSGDILWQDVSEEGPYNIAIDDINNDGVKDFVVIGTEGDIINSDYSSFTFIYDGESKALIDSFSIVDENDIISEISTIKIQDTVYLFVIGGSNSYIINLNSNDKNQIILDDYNFLDRGKFYHDRINNKIRIVCHNYESTYFFTFDPENNVAQYDGNLSEDYYYESIDFQIGNFDLDAEIEVAVLKSNKIVIVDLESRVIEKEIFVEEIPIDDFAIYTFQIKYNQDIGQYESWRPISSDKIEVINLQTEEKRFQNIIEGSIREMKFENLDQDRALEHVTLNDSKLIIYDDNFDVLFESFETVNISKFSHNYILINDNQDDSFKEINIGSYYGAFEYSLLNPYRDINLPEITEVKPINNSNGISIGTIVEFTFSKFMEVDSIKAYLDVSNSLGESLPYILEFDDENYLLKVSPSTSWPIQEELSFKFSNELKDPFENPLDGNRNGIIEGELDDFIVDYTTGEDSDIISPKIEVTVNTNEAYEGSFLFINGVINDSSSIAMSNIVYLEYFIDQDVVPGTGISFLPLDETFDAILEPFVLNFLTAGLDQGDHTLSFHGKDEYDNWSEVKFINFQIIDEDIANWSSYGANTLNHASNENSEFRAPFELKYEIDQDPLHHRFMNYKPIVVDDFLILNRPTINLEPSIEVRNLHNREILWTYFPEDAGRIHPPSYANGNVYFQVNTSPTSKLFCLDLLTGKINWVTEFNGTSLNLFGPTIYEGKVYIPKGVTGSFLGAYDAYNGDFIFETDLSFDMYDHWGPAILDSLLFCHTADLYRLDKDDGELLFTNEQIPLEPFGRDVVGSTIIDTANNQLILPSANFIFAVDMSTQNINWMISDSLDWYKSTPAIIENNLYTVTRTNMTEYNLLTGAQTWTSSIEDPGFANPYEAVANKDIIAFSTSANTYIFKRDSKELLLKLDQGGRMLISRDYLILGIDKGNILVYESKDIVSLNSLLKPRFIKIFPNLTSGKVTLEANDILNNVHVQITSLTGQVLNIYKYENLFNESLDLSFLNEGIYFIKVISGSESFTEKIFIER